jgi:hypothetical protein
MIGRGKEIMPEFDSEWMNAWQDVVNGDPTMAHIGRNFTTNFLLGFGDMEYVVSVREGRIERINDHLNPDVTWAFGLRGARESWEKFVQRIPPPFFNDIFAMASPLHGHLHIDGDAKVLWQNVRALTWMLARMREVPVAA